MKHLVVAVAYEGLCTFEFGCVVEVFGTARPELGVTWYDFAVHACDRASLLSAAGGIALHVEPVRGLLGKADTIIVPGWRGIECPAPAALLRDLRLAYKRGARICSICSGAFVLAQAGLLDGRRATTHWRFAEALQAQFPAVEVDKDALYIEQGSIVTAAGSAAGLDMMLHLVREDHGTRVATQVAQRLVLAPHRAGGQAQFVPRPMPMAEQDRMSRLMDRVRTKLAEPHDVGRWAVEACVSRRTLQRWFVQTLAVTPLTWLIQERVAMARGLLEESTLSISSVGLRCGFGSDESFRSHFRRIVGSSPASYQRSFGHPRR